MAQRFRKIRKPQLFVIMMIATAIFVFMPRDYFTPLRNIVHLAAYLPQQASTSAVNAVGSQVKDLSAKAVPAEEHEKSKRENLSLNNENIALRQQVAELRTTVRSLGRLRERGLKEGVLVPASVIGRDAAGWRESILLSKGKLANIRNQDWVTTHLALGAGSDAGVNEQSAVLAHECLIGWVEEVMPLNARVMLLTDAVGNRGMNVRVIPAVKDRPPLWENGRYVTFTLEGAGNGRMRMLDVFHDYVDKKQILEGDWVVCQPSPRLPASLVIGRIEKFERVKLKPVYYTAMVAPLFDSRSLEQVFVVDLSRPAAPGS